MGSPQIDHLNLDHPKSVNPTKWPTQVRLKVDTAKVANLGASIDPEAAEMIKKVYVADGSGGESKDTVNRLIRKEVEINGFTTFDVSG